MAEENALTRLGEAARARVASWRRERPERSLRGSRLYTRAPRSLARALAAPGPNVIAEVKFASPSEGFLRGPHAASRAEAARIASAYLEAGAAAVSVLTEPDRFAGHPEFVAAVREACPRACLLMKDFVVDEYQLELARACGADAVLLIAALLGPELPVLAAAARSRGLSALVEVHDEAQAEAALACGADVLGVNSRDLRTLRTDLAVARRLAPWARRAASAVAESGLRSREDIDDLAARGYRGFLIGTSLMKARDPGTALAALLEL